MLIPFRYSYKIHRRTHVKTRPKSKHPRIRRPRLPRQIYACQLCDKKYVRQDFFQNHVCKVMQKKKTKKRRQKKSEKEAEERMHQVIEDVIKDSVEFDNRIEETIEAVVKKAMLDNDDDPEWIGKQVQEMSEAIEEAVMSGLDGLDQNQAIVEKPKKRRKMEYNCDFCHKSFARRKTYDNHVCLNRVQVPETLLYEEVEDKISFKVTACLDSSCQEMVDCLNGQGLFEHKIHEIEEEQPAIEYDQVEEELGWLSDVLEIL